MKLNPVYAMLQRARQKLLERNMDEAHIWLMKTLDAAQKSSDSLLQAKVQHLWAQSLLVKARYASDFALCDVCLEKLTTAEKLIGDQTASDFRIEILITRAYVFMAKKENDLAYSIFQEAEKWSEDYELINQNILSQCAISQYLINQNNYQLALVYVEEAEQKLDAIYPQSNELIAEILYQKTQIFLKTQEYVLMEEKAKLLLEICIAERDVEKELFAINSLSIVKSLKGDYREAMEFLLEVQEKSRQIGHRLMTANALINIGTIFAHLFNYQDALNRYLTIINDYKDVLEPNNQVIVLNNIGNIYFNTANYDDALISFLEANKSAEALNYKEMVAHTHTQLSKTYLAKDMLNESLVHAEQASFYLQDMGDVNGKQINWLNQAQAHFKLADLESAIHLAHKGLKLSQKVSDNVTLMRGYKLMSEIYEQSKDYEKAFKYESLYSATQNRFTIEQKQRQAIDLEIKYAIREKQQQIELLTKENEFQSQLIEKSDQISKQNNQLVQANEELQQFAYVVSHDLKEPLRMIGSYSQLLMQKFENSLDEKSKPYSNYVSEGVSRMNNLLDALLQYATIGKEEEEKELIDIEGIIDDVNFNLKLLIRETDAKIEFENLPSIRCLPSRMIHLFQNLIGNAIKFRNTDVPLVIKISASENENEHIFKVEDNGIGIENEHLDRIFVIFQRLHTRKQYEGTGIGLAICQKIVQGMGGRIWVESELGKGSTFWFTVIKDMRDELDF